MKVIDESGRMFRSLGEALSCYGLPNNGNTYYNFKKMGELKKGGHTFTAIQEEEEPIPLLRNPASAQEDPLVTKLRERYSEDELKAIAAGQGIAKRFIPFPEIHLQGAHHRILVISDTHIGSVYSPEEWHGIVSGFANDPANGIECILHCGDLVDGLKIGRAGTQIYELTDIGFEAQRNKAVSLMSMYKLPIYIISGNHDSYFKEFTGVNIVKEVCDRLPNMTYIGQDSADLNVGGCTLRLFHGGDGNSYALSYRLQKLVESITGGKKPNIILAGHVHKFCYIFDRNIHAISVPAMQSQTAFMRARKLAAHTGFLILDFDTKDGNVCNLSVQLYPFYA